MAIVTDAQLYQYFETGDIPTQQQFRDLIDSKININNLPSFDLEVGVTQVDSGVDKLILFQNGTTLSQDSGFAFDYTNKRLGVTTATPQSAISVQSSTGNSSSATLALSFKRTDSPNTNTHVGAIWGLNNSNTVLTNFGTFYESGGGQRFSVSTSADNTNAGTEKMRLSKLGRLSLGATMLDGAMLDIQSAGALSTDIALRVRNSANTSDLVSVRGNGEIYVPIVGNNAVNTIFTGTQSLLRYSNENFNNVQLGIGSSISATNYIQTIIGSGNTSNGGANSILGVFNNTGTATYGIIIGGSNRLVDLSSNVIRIGNGVANQQFGGTNSIHIGTFTGATVANLTADNLFQMYFGARVPSLVGTSIGTFGLIQDSTTTLSYIYDNTTKTNQLGTGGNTLVIANHTNNPSTNLTDKFQLYSADITAGNAAPHFRTENGNIIKLYRETTAVGSSTLVAGAGGSAKHDDTYDGYTLAQIVKALRNLGILA